MTGPITHRLRETAKVWKTGTCRILRLCKSNMTGPLHGIGIPARNGITFGKRKSWALKPGILSGLLAAPSQLVSETLITRSLGSPVAWTSAIDCAQWTLRERESLKLIDDIPFSLTCSGISLPDRSIARTSCSRCPKCCDVDPRRIPPHATRHPCRPGRFSDGSLPSSGSLGGTCQSESLADVRAPRVRRMRRADGRHKSPRRGSPDLARCTAQRRSCEAPPWVDSCVFTTAIVPEARGGPCSEPPPGRRRLGREASGSSDGTRKRIPDAVDARVST